MNKKEFEFAAKSATNAVHSLRSEVGVSLLRIKLAHEAAQKANEAAALAFQDDEQQAALYSRAAAEHAEGAKRIATLDWNLLSHAPEMAKLLKDVLFDVNGNLRPELQENIAKLLAKVC